MPRRKGQTDAIVKKEAANAEAKFRQLIDLIARLRSENGCPWDRSRKKEDIGRYLIDESYEVLDALAGRAPGALKEELGDLLFQILFLARMAEEAEEFDIAAVLDTVTEKMIRRHPHVFAGTKVDSVEEVRENWARIKKEVEHKGEQEARLCDGLPRSLSTLGRAQRISCRASEVGFDWEDAEGVLKKVEEELAEFRDAIAVGDRRAMHSEAGDLLLTLVNLCRFESIDAEAALRTALSTFCERFSHIERELATRGKTPAGSSLAEMDLLWNDAKQKINKKGHPEKP
jgi:tetrapyrrole methylase family protein / MazG family protein